MKKYYVVVNNEIIVAVEAASKSNAENKCLAKYWVETALALDTKTDNRLIANEYSQLNVVGYDGFDRIQK